MLSHSIGLTCCRSSSSLLRAERDSRQLTQHLFVSCHVHWSLCDLHPVQFTGGVEDGDATELQAIRRGESQPFEIYFGDFASSRDRSAKECREDHVPCGSALQAKGAVGFPLGISDTGEFRAETPPEPGGLFAGALADRHHLCARRVKTLEFALHLNQVLTAERSPEVPQEYQDERATTSQVSGGDPTSSTLLQ